MKFLLIPLASLLLYTSVSAHPSKRQFDPNGVFVMEEQPGSEDVDDLVEMPEEACGMKREQLDKLETVTPTEVFSVMNSAAQIADDLAYNFSRMEKNIEGQNIEQMMSDANLRRKFGRLVEAAFKNELCGFISMQMILDRISYMGADGFTDAKCTQTYQMVSKFEDVANKPKGWLLGVEDLIKNDVKCILQDLAKHGAFLKNLAVPAVRKHGSYLVDAIRRFIRRA